jgi:hypothetical protein
VTGNYKITDLDPIADEDIAAGVILAVVDPADIVTQPADADGSNKRMTLAQLASFLGGT